MPASTPKPTALRVYEGKRAHRPLPKGEPQPPLGAPPTPENLPPLGKWAWERQVALIAQVPGWLSTVDWRVLENWALDYAVWRDCVAAIQEHGLTFMDSFTDSSGQEHLKPKARPELKSMNEASIRLLKADAALGFAPAYRARISINPPGSDKHDDLDAY